MTTEIRDIDEESLDYADGIIKSGGLVAFPTETVYGLGADAFSDAAVEKIYEVKNRPADNPLIVHVHRDYDLEKLVRDVRPYALKLMDSFMPGPLTLVFEGRGAVSERVTFGGKTLAVRMPSHEGAQRFLRKVNLPVAAPSANLSKHTSPVTAEHVYEDLNGRIPLILQGGRCSGGIESTVVDVTGDVPAVLRPGLVTAEMIREVTGECLMNVSASGGPKSPGMKYRHYHPHCETVLYPLAELESAIERYEICLAGGGKPCFLCDGETAAKLGARRILNLGTGKEQISENLYYKLREAEKKADLLICIELSGDGLEGAVNRLGKACADEK